MFNRWTEPVILLLIILNAVVLTIQAARSTALPAPDDSDSPPLSPPHIRGYFHTWEDYTLFVLFVLFTYVHSNMRLLTHRLTNVQPRMFCSHSSFRLPAGSRGSGILFAIRYLNITSRSVDTSFILC